MAFPLLLTKLYFPPVRRDFVPRPRLVERLGVGLRGPLTLLCAPAGYGKTTLLSEWRAGLGQGFPAAWLSLEAGDGDLTLFLRYLTAAMGTLQADLVEKTALLLESPQPPPVNAILTSLVNEVSGFPDDFALILDDYHVIANLEQYTTPSHSCSLTRHHRCISCSSPVRIRRCRCPSCARGDRWQRFARRICVSHRKKRQISWRKRWV